MNARIDSLQAAQPVLHADQQIGGIQFNDDFRKRRREADYAQSGEYRAIGGQQQNRQRLGCCSVRRWKKCSRGWSRLWRGPYCRWHPKRKW